MTRKFFAFTVGLGLLACAGQVAAQPDGKIYRIGFLTAVAAEPLEARLTAFRQGLQARGYAEGKNLVIAERYANGARKKLPGLAAELVRLRPDVIVVHGDSIARIANTAAKKAGRTIPIVLGVSSDPVGSGIVASLAHPGGNITGLTSASGALVGKRLQLIKEIVPSASRIAVFWNSRVPPIVLKMKALKAMAPDLGVTLVPVEFAKSNVDRAFDALLREPPHALDVLQWGLVMPHYPAIADFALSNRLPAIGGSEMFVRAGGLMSYSVDGVALYRRAAAYVDKILKGARPADLPVE